MLSVAIHKDVSEYKPKVVGKLTTRTLVSILGALGASVIAGLYMNFVLGLNVDDYMFVIYAVSIPFWCIGFMRPEGMPFEQFFPLWLNHKFSTNRIFYVSTMHGSRFVAQGTGEENKHVSKQYRKLRQTRGAESYEPTRGAVRGRADAVSSQRRDG